MSSKVKNIRVFEINLGKVVVNDPKNRESKVMVDQIRSIDKQKLGKKGGTLTPEQMSKVEEALKQFLVLSEKNQSQVIIKSLKYNIKDKSIKK